MATPSTNPWPLSSEEAYLRQQTANNPERVSGSGFFFAAIRAVMPSNVVADHNATLCRAEKRRKEHQAARTAALEEIEHIALVESTLKLELDDLERAEAEADRKQHAEEGKKQANELARVFRALDHAVRTTTTAFRDARELVDQARQRGYFAVSREHADLLMGDALNSGLQGLNFDRFKVPYVEPMRRKAFSEIGDRWAAAMKGRADQAITSRPPTPSVPPAAAPVLPPPVTQQSPPAAQSIEAKPPKRADLTKSLPGDMALGGFRVYGSKAEADAARQRMEEGQSR